MPDPSTPTRAHVAIALFPGVTQLDFTGPLEVFQRVPPVHVDLVAHALDPIECASLVPAPMKVLPSARFSDLTQTDILFVPGGPGVSALIDDERSLGELRRLASSARYITSVCTGSLALGAAGLLQGFRATTHWAYLECLTQLGAVPVAERVVVDRNRITGAGVSSGIDFALRLVGEIWGEQRAQSAQLSMEYDPQPPFDAGSPTKAPAHLVSATRERMQPLTQRTGAAVARAAARFQRG